MTRPGLTGELGPDAVCRGLGCIAIELAFIESTFP